MRRFLCTINLADANEFFLYTNKAGALMDLKKTLENPSIPDEFLEGISMAAVDEELKSCEKRKNEKFFEIYRKYGWEKESCPEHIFLYESGKVYVYDSPQDGASCGCGDSHEK